MTILVIIYLVAGYWATGKTIFANKILIYSQPGDLFFQRVMYGAVFGLVLIPWAILKGIFSR